MERAVPFCFIHSFTLLLMFFSHYQEEFHVLLLNPYSCNSVKFTIHIYFCLLYIYIYYVIHVHTDIDTYGDTI